MTRLKTALAKAQQKSAAEEDCVPGDALVIHRLFGGIFSLVPLPVSQVPGQRGL